METLTKEQLRIFNAGQSKNDQYLAELIAEQISTIIRQHPFTTKQDLLDELSDRGLKTLRLRTTWKHSHLDTICKHVPQLADELDRLFNTNTYRVGQKAVVVWQPKRWKLHDLCKRVELLHSGKRVTHYRCVKSHTSSHMFSLDYSCWKKIDVR